MRNILVLGAGQSAATLIHYLLGHAAEGRWRVTVADRDAAPAERVVRDNERGCAIAIDVNDGAALAALIEDAALVVNLLPQSFQHLVAWNCLQQGRHMISVSYRDQELEDLSVDALRQGVLLLFEVGLDPGIDLMSAMAMIEKIHDRGGVVQSFESYGSGVPADPTVNPLHYCLTWNPRNVVMAGEHGSQYLQDGRVKVVPWHQMFQSSWGVEIPHVGMMEAYPNRDSIAYRDILGIQETRTLIRGTLRYPGWCETWYQVVRLGLPNEHLRIPDLASLSPRDVVEMFLPRGLSGTTLEQRVARHLQISPTGRIMENLAWLGLFDSENIEIEGATSTEFLVHLLRSRLQLPEDQSDLIVLLHRIEARFPAEDGRIERMTSSFVEKGEPGGVTAMSRTVGLPAGIVARLLLEDRLSLTGCHVPTHKIVYEPVLAELEREGIVFDERLTFRS